VDGAAASAEVDFIEQINALCVDQQKAIGGLIGPLVSGERSERTGACVSA
jgi:hypothetical protein